MPAARFAACHLGTRLGYAAAFLAGAVVALIVTLFGGEDSPPAPESAARPRSETDPVATSEILAATPVAPSSADASKALLGADFACHPRPGESAGDEFQRVLRELVQAPVEERQSRLALLLARLRERGVASVPAIVAYLREGRNVASEALFGEVAFLGGASHYKDLRTFLYLTLAQIAEAQPGQRAQIAAEGLELATHLHETLALADAAADDPATRRQAIESVTRLMNPTSLFSSLHETIRATVRLKSEELMIELGDFLEQNPYHVSVEGFLGALWNFPDAFRIELSRRIAASAMVREKMRPESWQWLDMRDPILRGRVVQEFQATAVQESDHAQHASLTLLQRLGEARETAQSRYHKFPIGSLVPQPGAPDSREQIAARINLLGELERFCQTPLLQAQLEEARTRLAARLAQP